MPLASQIGLEIDLAAAAIAVIALIFSVWTWRNQSWLELENLRIQRDNDIIRWTNETIDVICEAERLMRGGSGLGDEAEFTAFRDQCAAKLSASIDKGRLYFPNVEDDGYGIEKEAAYRGHRQPILDHLVRIHDLIRPLERTGDPEDSSLYDAFIASRRGFVSEAQAAVEPRRRIGFLARRGRGV